MQLRRGSLTWQVIEDEVVVLDLEGSVYLKLNGSAKLLWERLSKSCTEPELVAALVETYAIDPEMAHEDVSAFLADVRDRGLIEPSS